VITKIRMLIKIVNQYVRRSGWRISLLLWCATVLIHIGVFLFNLISRWHVKYPESLDGIAFKPLLKLVHAGKRTAVWHYNDWGEAYFITTDGEAVASVVGEGYEARVYKHNNLYACIAPKSREGNMFCLINTNDHTECYIYDYNADGICDLKQIGNEKWRYIPGYWEKIVNTNSAYSVTNN